MIDALILKLAPRGIDAEKDPFYWRLTYLALLAINERFNMERQNGNDYLDSKRQAGPINQLGRDRQVRK